MTDKVDKKLELDSSADALDVSEGLYHEAQADGVPYDEQLEPFTRDLPRMRR